MIRTTRTWELADTAPSVVTDREGDSKTKSPLAKSGSHRLQKKYRLILDYVKSLFDPQATLVFRWDLGFGEFPRTKCSPVV